MRLFFSRKILILIFTLCPVMASAAVKIGFVDMVKVMEKTMEESPQAEVARKALEKEFLGRDKKLQTERDEILKIEETLNKDTDILSDSRRNELEKEIFIKKREYQERHNEFRKDFSARRDQELNKLRQNVHEIVIKVAEGENYDLVVTQPVLFASTRIDMTELVLQALQRSW